MPTISAVALPSTVNQEAAIFGGEFNTKGWAQAHNVWPIDVNEKQRFDKNLQKEEQERRFESYEQKTRSHNATMTRSD